jgi:hypothetical protein
VARTWLVINVELVSGGGRGDFWPRPGRTFIASRTHTFEQLAEAIDDAFGRWDLAHLHEFTLADGICIGTPDPDWDEGRVIVDSRRTKLSRLAAGEQFAYVFDLGDYWAHLCTVGPERADPVEAYGIIPPRPAAIFGWGDLPDQYGRRWLGDDGEGGRPPDPKGKDLPPILPRWQRRIS